MSKKDTLNYLLLNSKCYRGDKQITLKLSDTKVVIMNKSTVAAFFFHNQWEGRGEE